MNDWQRGSIQWDRSETVPAPPWSVSIPHPRLSIAAPCYNEEAGLAEFHRQATDAAGAAAGDDYEIVMVNDGSGDRTRAVTRTLSAH